MIFLLLLIVFGVILAWFVCTIIGQWQAFKKAGKEGWEAIVPIYNQYILCQITGVDPLWLVIVYVGSFVLAIIPVIGSLASSVLMIYFFVILYVSTARSFGKEDGFAAGLWFLSPVFWLIIGGNNVQYVGPRPMNDQVMAFINEKILNKPPKATNVNNGFQQPMNNGFQQPMYQQPMNNGMAPQMPMNNTYPQQNVVPPVVEVAPMSQPVENPTPTTPTVNRFCANCGYNLSNGEQFCPSCGKQNI